MVDVLEVDDTEDQASPAVEPSQAAETAPDKAPASSPVIPAELGMEELRQQVERTRREVADRDRLLREASARAQAAEKQVIESRKGAVDGVLASLARDREIAKQDIISGHEAGDFAKVADAQDRLAAAHARIAAAEQASLALKEQAENPPPPVYVDHAEILARSMYPRAAAWIRAHPRFAQPGADNDRMVQAHHAALGKGIEERGDEYFEYLETALGLRQEESRQGKDRDDAPRSRPIVNAPPSRRSGAVTANVEPGRVTLSAAERETAIALNTDPKRSEEEILRAYAKNKRALIAEGKISA
jgi:hypothetical protein